MLEQTLLNGFKFEYCLKAQFNMKRDISWLSASITRPAPVFFRAFDVASIHRNNPTLMIK